MPIPADSDIVVLEGQPYPINRKHYWKFPDGWRLYGIELNQVGYVEDDDDD